MVKSKTKSKDKITNNYKNTVVHAFISYNKEQNLHSQKWFLKLIWYFIILNSYILKKATTSIKVIDFTVNESKIKIVVLNKMIIRKILSPLKYSSFYRVLVLDFLLVKKPFSKL